MRVAVDTNRLADLFRGDEDLASFLQTCDEICLPLIVLGELKAGFLGGSQRERNERLLSAFLSREPVRVLLPQPETADYYARVYVDLKRAGKPIPDNDVWIAALALQHRLTLITRDRHFQNVAELPLR